MEKLEKENNFMSKLNNILILGNGFDLNLGLNSRFSDYISDVFAKENIKLSEIVKYLDINDKKQRLYVYNQPEDLSHPLHQLHQQPRQRQLFPNRKQQY